SFTTYLRSSNGQLHRSHEKCSIIRSSCANWKSASIGQLTPIVSRNAKAMKAPFGQKTTNRAEVPGSAKMAFFHLSTQEETSKALPLEFRLEPAKSRLRKRRLKPEL